MSAKRSIFTLTVNPAVDMSCVVDRLTAEHKLRCGRPSYHPGGGGINVARAIQELGGQAIAYWICGGVMGDFLKQLLDQEGCPHVPIAIDGMTRENLVVTDESSGDQFRFCMPGPTLTEWEARKCLDVLGNLDPPPDYLVLSGSLPPGAPDDFYTEFARAAAPHSYVVLDTSGPPLRDGLKGPVDLTKPNLRELGELVGRKVQGEQDIKDAARSLIDQTGLGAVVTSLGRDGAVLTTASEFQHIRAPEVPVSSKVGAGDSMVAGIVLGLSRGMSILQAVRFGIAAGSAAAMTPGTQLCRRSDVERLFSEMAPEIVEQGGP